VEATRIDLEVPRRSSAPTKARPAMEAFNSSYARRLRQKVNCCSEGCRTAGGRSSRVGAHERHSRLRLPCCARDRALPKAPVDITSCLTCDTCLTKTHRHQIQHIASPQYPQSSVASTKSRSHRLASPRTSTISPNTLPSVKLHLHPGPPSTHPLAAAPHPRDALTSRDKAAPPWGWGHRVIPFTTR
jgi:hypothetical protein